MCLGYFSPLCNWSLFHKKLPGLSRIPVLDLPATVVVSLFGSKLLPLKYVNVFGPLCVCVCVCVCYLRDWGKTSTGLVKKFFLKLEKVGQILLYQYE